MKRSKYFDTVNQAIANRSHTGHGSFILTIDKNQVVCLRQSLYTDSMPIFADLSDYSDEFGLTINQWEEAFKKIEKHFDQARN